MSKDRLSLAARAESTAAEFLQKNGYRIIARNYRSRFGEIDIIASQRRTICFVEVKARSSARFGLPEEAITDIKKRHIAKTALTYLKDKKLNSRKARFDVLSITYLNKRPQIRLIKDAFSLDGRYSY